MSYPIPENEEERLDALERLNILDTEDEAVFDRIAEVTQLIFDVENSAVSLITDEHQWFKAFCGWDFRETPREVSLCAHTIVNDDVLVVEDLQEDPRFTDHPLRKSDAPIRFYAGASLVVEEDLHIGTLCVADPAPRSFTDDDRAVLSALAGFTADLLGMRRQARKVSSLTSALQQVNEAILITEAEPLDPPGPRIQWVNEACVEMTGYDREELLGETPRILQGPRTDRTVLDRVRAALEAEEVVKAEAVNYQKNGRPYMTAWTITPVRDDEGEVAQWVSVQRDVTDAHVRNRELEQRALHDDLTGLLRRTEIEERMQEAMDTDAGAGGGVLFLDIDRFKRVNDTLGHGAGDQLLKAVADTLEGVTRSDDAVARFGGDEFVVWLAEADEEASRQVAERIIEAFRHPFQVAGEELYAEVSIGIVNDLRAYDRAETVLRDADTAMYEAKDVPGPSFVIHESEMQAGVAERLRLDTALREAVREEAFEPFLHPIIRLSDGTLHGYEVLARWRQADGTIVTPGVFLDVAEETGLLTPIGHQVIEEACRGLHDLQGQHRDSPRVALSGNFSRSDFFKAGTHDFVRTVLDRYDIAPSHFTMEITERVLEDNVQYDLTEISELKALGVRMEVDDFGTGYSSLLSLLDLPVDGVKFDKDLTATLTDRDRGPAIVESVLQMADRLGLSATAEGIETSEQLAILRDLGCMYGQGYLFTRPIPASELPSLLDEAPWRTYWES